MLAKYYAPPHQTQPGTGIVADLGTGPGGPGMGGLSSLKDQKAFEKGLWEKIRRGGGESSIHSWALVVRVWNSSFWSCIRIRTGALLCMTDIAEFPCP